MSYDLMVFEVANAPTSKKEFLTWYSRQVEWSEDHDYESIEVSSAALQNWFLEMKDIFPPLNGEYAPGDDDLDEDSGLEERMADYCIGQDVIYVAFGWSLAQEAYTTMTRLAQQHQVGFFDVSSDDGSIILPDGTKMA